MSDDVASAGAPASRPDARIVGDRRAALALAIFAFVVAVECLAWLDGGVAGSPLAFITCGACHA